jgi:hypothetical protein
MIPRASLIYVNAGSGSSQKRRFQGRASHFALFPQVEGSTAPDAHMTDALRSTFMCAPINPAAGKPGIRLMDLARLQSAARKDRVCP